MPNFILADDSTWQNLLPLTFTCPVSEIRAGITTIKEKWEHHLGKPVSYLTENYLREKYKPVFITGQSNIWINSSLIASEELVMEIKHLRPGSSLFKGDTLIALNTGNKKITSFPSPSSEAKVNRKKAEEFKTEWKGEEIFKINRCWDIFTGNGECIKQDFKELKAGKISEKYLHNNKFTGNKVYIEKGAKITGAWLNSSEGPIYIGKDAEIMENSVLYGPLAICEGAVVKAGTRIYGPTTIGPFSKVGGEVSNSVILGYSNKAHDGFIGNSVIGEWCNLGAGTNTSNLKNNYSEVKVWDYESKKPGNHRSYLLRAVHG